MDDKFSNPMTPFDCLISNQNLQMTKLLIPYLPPQSQRIFAIYVKFLEFQNTISSFRTFQHTSHSVQDIIHDIRPYMSSSSAEAIDNFLNIMNMMELFQNMQASSDSDFDPMNMMSDMLTPEQQSMFEMYNTMFSSDNETQSQQGGETTD